MLGGVILGARGVSRVHHERKRIKRTRQVLDLGTHHIVEKNGRQLSSHRPHKIVLATGTGGCRQAARDAQAEVLYRVAHETELLVLFDLDLAHADTLINAVPAAVPALCLHGDEDNPRLGLGLLNKTLAEQKELKHFWFPAQRGLQEFVEQRVKQDRVYPSLILLNTFTGGGHALTGLAQAVWAAETWPEARRVGIAIISEEERKRQQIIAVLEIADQLRVNGKPVVDTILIADNRLHPDRQDEMGAHLIGCAESAVTSGNQRGDNLGNLFTLPNQRDIDGIHYLFMHWARSSVPVEQPSRRSVWQRLMGTAAGHARSDASVVAEEAFTVADKLVSGHGEPALLAPLDKKSGTALFLGIPSADWDVVEHAKEILVERLDVKGPVDHNRRGPIVGRYDLPATENAPVVGILLGEVADGLNGVKAAINAIPITYERESLRLAPSAGAKARGSTRRTP